MSMLAEQILGDEKRFQEFREADLRARARMTEKIPELGASLVQQYEVAVGSAPLARTRATILTQEGFRIAEPGPGTWIGVGLASEERIVDRYRRLVMSKMTQLSPQGPFLQKPVPDELIALQKAAESKHRREFAHWVRTIKWFGHPPSALTRAIDLALALDMVQVAKGLAQEGCKLFPRDKRIQRAASVLSPPLVLKTRPVQITDFEVSQQWLRDHASHHKGLWVAVRAGTLLGSAPTLRELYQRIGSAGRTPNTIIIKALS